ncbi:uncharacterized protein BCR38DRAFT_487265 [Pseudomassariella vexata]|uniref:Uncharacterized protein n=1 Tax=Pseudomassariella vexata TaxID=1141098 RepID=A0A1Y2DQE0_9PEZI|nr:uncharacterized protein BCR38DRAFT_487265 [Pseudomassariella vexata]ORY61511.1 hypothetical protein BCR38DRAFT_487265 [Pseudomassariella vexata]
MYIFGMAERGNAEGYFSFAHTFTVGIDPEGVGLWTFKVNKLYKKLFHVDINHLCSPRGAERPVTPLFKSKVKVHCIQAVQVREVTKFTSVNGSRYNHQR